jgi:hypothetical protein
MVDRMALVCLGSKEARAEWSELNKHLKDANENRNKLAHSSVEFEMLSAETRDGITHLEIGSPKLRPAYENVVSKLIGRTPDKEEHNLDAEAIKQCVVQFKLLEGRLMAFLMDRQPRFRI